MKQKDIILIVFVIILTGIVTFFASNALFGSQKQRQEKVEVIEPITSDFPKPDSKYFNSNSIDPTQQITIGNNQNTKPFNVNGN